MPGPEEFPEVVAGCWCFMPSMSINYSLPKNYPVEMEFGHSLQRWLHRLIKNRPSFTIFAQGFQRVLLHLSGATLVTGSAGQFSAFFCISSHVSPAASFNRWQSARPDFCTVFLIPLGAADQCVSEAWRRLGFSLSRSTALQQRSFCFFVWQSNLTCWKTK